MVCLLCWLLVLSMLFWRERGGGGSTGLGLSHIVLVVSIWDPGPQRARFPKCHLGASESKVAPFLRSVSKFEVWDLWNFGIAAVLTGRTEGLGREFRVKFRD